MMSGVEGVDMDYLDYVVSAIEEGATPDDVEELLPGLTDPLDGGDKWAKKILAKLVPEKPASPTKTGTPEVLQAPVVASDFGEAKAEEKEAKTETRKQKKAKQKEAKEVFAPPSRQQAKIEVTTQQSRFAADLDDGCAAFGIDIKGLCISVGDRPLIVDTRLQLFPGRYGFIGANGAGKSTLMRAIADKLIPGFPADATVLVEQEDVGDNRTPVQTVVDGHAELGALKKEETILQTGLEAGTTLAAVCEVKFLRLETERHNHSLQAAKLTRARGDAASQDLLAAEHRVAEAEKALEAARAAGPSSEGEAECAAMLGEVRERLAILDEAGVEAKAQQVLNGLGFTEAMLQGPTSRLSGGWRMRVALAKALTVECQVIMMDEPTNHLDWDSILWLEKHLKTMEDVTLIIVSHDRQFMDNVCNRILRLFKQRLDVFEGNYSDYENTREEGKLDQAKMAERMQDKRDKMEAQIAKMERDGRKSNNENLLSQVASRRKKMGIGRDKTRAEGMTVNRVGLERSLNGGAFKLSGDKKLGFFGAHLGWGAEAVLEFEDPVSMSLKSGANLGYHGPVLQCRGVAVGYKGHPVLIQPFDLNIEVTSRIGLLGVNGSGKTSILSTIGHSLPPRAGEVYHYPRLTVGYFSQHQVEALPLDEPAIGFLKSLKPEANEGTIRGHLASFGLRGDHVLQPMGSLSGGEKTRVSLASITFKAPHVLLLDEPSNHLDLLTVEALSGALREFEGGIVLVSHDRRLINELCNEHYLVEKGKIRKIEGGLAAFMRKVGRESR